MYWDITVPLAYQRNFNFINGERSIGKTYTTLKYFVKRFITKQEQFVYLVRTQMEQKNKILKAALDKVMTNEYPEYEVNYNITDCTVDGMLMAHCIALTEADKVKKRSYPLVRWLIFDEYMIDEAVGGHYINGWREPDALLSIYHTIDREADVVKCFLLGNNITFYNPYHMHPAFNIPSVEKGKIWTSENVLFQWADSDGELKAKKADNKFLRMVAATQYGQYAVKGDYIFDNFALVGPRNPLSRYVMTIKTEGVLLGVWTDGEYAYISDKVDPTAKVKVGLTPDDVNTEYKIASVSSLFRWLSERTRHGQALFDTMELKQRNALLLSALMRR